MKAILQSNHFNKKSFVSLVLSFVIVFGMLSGMLAKPASAKTVRLAVISSMSGDVTVQKGGSKVYDAYTNMSLNQGDMLYTGADSSVVLSVGNDDAEITLGANTEFNISDLQGQSEGKKSKLKMWAGSMWVKVKSLVGSNDQFEIETPTAVMGVRGTNFYVGVESASGQTTMAVASGEVEATMVTNNTESGEQEESTTVIDPTQQITVDSRDEAEYLSLKVEPIDLDQIIAQASAAVLEAIIKSKMEIDEENVRFIEEQQQRLEQGEVIDDHLGLVIRSLEDLEKVTRNINNLVGNIALKAVEENIISQEQIERIVEEANSKITDEAKKLDLNNVEPLDPAAGVDPERERQRQAELERMETERKQKEEADQRLREQLRELLAEYIKQSEEGQKLIAQMTAKAEAEARAKAEADLLAGLTQEQRDRYYGNQNHTSTPGNQPPAGNNNNNDSNDSNDREPTVTPPVIKLTKSSDEHFPLLVNIEMNFAEANSIYAVEVHLLHGNMMNYLGDAMSSSSESEITLPMHDASLRIFDPAQSVEVVKTTHGENATGENYYEKEVVYAITNFGEAPNQSVTAGLKQLVSLPFMYHIPDEEEDPLANIKIGYVKIVKKNGSQIINLNSNYSGEPLKIDLSELPVFLLPGLD